MNLDVETHLTLRHEKPDSTYYVAFDSFKKEHLAFHHHVFYPLDDVRSQTTPQINNITFKVDNRMVMYYKILINWNNININVFACGDTSHNWLFIAPSFSPFVSRCGRKIYLQRRIFYWKEKLRKGVLWMHSYYKGMCIFRMHKMFW